MNMNMIEFIIFFSGALYILCSLLYLAEQEKTSANYILSGFLFTVGIWQLYHGCMVSGLLMRYPHLGLVHVPFLYLTAPLLYFYFKILIGENFRFSRSSALHLVPCIVFTILLLPFYIQSAEEKRVLIENPLKQPMAYPFYPVIILFMILTISVYAAAFIVRVVPLFMKKELTIKKITLFTIVILALECFLILFYLSGFAMYRIFNASREFYLFVIETISLVQAVQICLIMLIKIRYPDYFNQIKDEGQRIRYVSSRIEGLNVQEVLHRLGELMEVEKIFCDEDLTLTGLAHQLDISHYQLSQILNERINKNFNTYINEYRIKEAEKLLVEEPERSITSISYAVGFNTISSFYNSFTRIHNMSAAVFRKKLKK